MKLLLDTHIWFWSVLEPQRLSPRVARELADEDNELWLSARLGFGNWLLRRKGRLSEPQDISAWVAASVRDLEVTEAPLTIEVALVSRP